MLVQSGSDVGNTLGSEVLVNIGHAIRMRIAREQLRYLQSLQISQVAATDRASSDHQGRLRAASTHPAVS
jgi:hypothetical protein